MTAKKALHQPARPHADESNDTPNAVAAEARIVQHPDGYYWLSGTHEVGPFATLDDARADLQAAEAAETGPEPGETLAEAEADLGVEDWIDPETGSLAEAQRPRIEDH